MSSVLLSSAGYVVTGNRYISIGVRVAGRIDAYEAQEGDFVRKGDVLVRLDDRDYKATLRRAEANLELAKANLVLKRKQSERLRQLHERGLISLDALEVVENEHAVAQATVHQAEAEVLLARVNLDYTKLTSPTDGIVLAKLKEVGEIAVPGGFLGAGDLIRIANLDDLRGEVDINEVDFHHIHMTQPVEVAPDAYPDRKYAAQVVKIYPQANRQKGTLKVEVKLAKADAYLRPDMSVRINSFRRDSDRWRNRSGLAKRGALSGWRARVCLDRRVERSCAPPCRRERKWATWCRLPAGSMAVKRSCCQAPNRFTKGCLSRQPNRPLRVNLAFHVETVQKGGEAVSLETEYIFIHTIRRVVMKVGMSIFMQNTNDKWTDYEVYQNDLNLADLAEPLGLILSGASSITSRHTRWCRTFFSSLPTWRGAPARSSLARWWLSCHGMIPYASRNRSPCSTIFERPPRHWLCRGAATVEYNGFRVAMEESRDRFVGSRRSHPQSPRQRAV
jgi:RND family efflux transporter MFP subunit